MNRANLQHCFFWFGNTGGDAAIAILLPTLNRFNCNAAVDCSTIYFGCESVFTRNGDSFVIAKREFRRAFGIYRNCATLSAQAIKTWVRNFETTGSTLSLMFCTICRSLATGSQSDTDCRRAEWCGLLSKAPLTTAIFSVVHADLTLPPFFFRGTAVAQWLRYCATN
jgi:hypothetical protein